MPTALTSWPSMETTLKSTSPQQLMGQRGPSIRSTGDPPWSLITNLGEEVEECPGERRRWEGGGAPRVDEAPLLLHHPDHRARGGGNLPGGTRHTLTTSVTHFHIALLSCAHLSGGSSSSSEEESSSSFSSFLISDMRHRDIRKELKDGEGIFYCLICSLSPT